MYKMHEMRRNKGILFLTDPFFFFYTTTPSHDFFSSLTLVSVMLQNNKVVATQDHSSSVTQTFFFFFKVDITSLYIKTLAIKNKKSTQSANLEANLLLTLI